jgi:predicted DNA-binding transcriptional regulator YafY
MKLDRLLAITILLINKKRISARELAERFEVSIRTIHRDIEAINCAGIPVASFQGAAGGFGIMENYKIDRNVLTINDIYSIVTALKGMNTTFDDKHVSDILEKISGLVPECELSNAAIKRGQTIIDYSPWGWGDKQKQKINTVRKAIEESRLISFNYTSSKGENVRRTIEPMGIVFKGFFWYFYGYCRLRNDYRFFRISRVKDLNQETESFKRRNKSFEDIQIDLHWKDDNQKFIRLVLKFRPEAYMRVVDSFDEDMIWEQTDGSYMVEVSFPEDEWVYGTILSYGNDVEVIEPQYLRDIIRDRAKKVWEQYI